MQNVPLNKVLLNLVLNIIEAYSNIYNLAFLKISKFLQWFNRDFEIICEESFFLYRSFNRK